MTQDLRRRGSGEKPLPTSAMPTPAGAPRLGSQAPWPLSNNPASSLRSLGLRKEDSSFYLSFAKLAIFYLGEHLCSISSMEK